MKCRLLMTAILQSRFVGGTERSFLHLLEGIPGDEYEVAVGLDETMLTSEFALAVHALGQRVIPFCDVVSKRDFGGMYRTIGQIHSFQPDLVHVHLNHPAANPFLVFAAKAAGVRRIVLTEQLNILLDQTRFGRWRIRLYCRLANTVVAVSQAVRDGLVGHYGVAGANVIVIENAVDARRIAESVRTIDRQALRESLGLDPDAYVLGCAAAMRWQKGQRFLIDAMPQVLAAIPNARLVLIGDGEGRQALETRIQELGLEDTVQILGWRTDATNLLAALDAFVLPSLYEGLPLAVLEAMAARLPVIATRVDGTGEAVHHRTTGILVAPQDPSALADAMIEVATNRSLARLIAASAQQHVLARYDISVMQQRYLALYDLLYSRLQQR
ncbi:MAG: glycosyltransferase family 4 protein [Caldilineaceae bacterium]|nr:glycosyltransferase family 4 protein [Caldilineaceae bacterium]